jgi:anti-anti-sigma regulatory factor
MDAGGRISSVGAASSVADARSKTISLPAVVDLDALDAVRDRLLDALDAGPVTVTGAAVERVATNALIMLVSAAETARRNGFAFWVAKLSEPMQAAIDRLGLTATFAGMTKG